MNWPECSTKTVHRKTGNWPVGHSSLTPEMYIYFYYISVSGLYSSSLTLKMNAYALGIKIGPSDFYPLYVFNIIFLFLYLSAQHRPIRFLLSLCCSFLLSISLLGERNC